LGQVVWCATALLALIQASACSSGAAPARARPPDAGRAHREAPSAAATDSSPVVRLLIDAEPAHLNPDLDPDEWCYRLAADAIYEPLWRESPGGGFEGVLADHFSVEDGGRRYLFHIRPGVTFHDGKPLHSTDVAFTFDRLRTAGAHAPRENALLADLDRVELAGPDAVRFWALRPSSALQHALAEVQILPEHVFGRGELAYQGANRRPVGTGPLELKSWERGAKLVLARNPRYWGTPARAEEVDVAIQPDALASLGAARRSEVDLVGRVPPAWVPEQIDSPSLRAGYRAVRLTPTRSTGRR
jgi:peptide/nickel transport system substrate-binding protein